MKKRFLAMLLAAIMMVGMVPSVVFAQEEAASAIPEELPEQTDVQDGDAPQEGTIPQETAPPVYQEHTSTEAGEFYLVVESSANQTKTDGLVVAPTKVPYHKGDTILAALLRLVGLNITQDFGENLEEGRIYINNEPYIAVTDKQAGVVTLTDVVAPSDIGILRIHQNTNGTPLDYFSVELQELIKAMVEHKEDATKKAAYDAAVLGYAEAASTGGEQFAWELLQELEKERQDSDSESPEDETEQKTGMLASVEIAGQLGTEGRLVPAFDPNVFDYTVKLSAREANAYVTATLQEGMEAELKASWKQWNNLEQTSHTDLSSGMRKRLGNLLAGSYQGNGNVLHITAGSGEDIQEYTFTVEKEYPLGVLEAQLGSGEDIALDPAFDEDVHEYRATVPADTEKINLAALYYHIKWDNNLVLNGETVTVNGTEMPQTESLNELPYEEFVLDEGENVFAIEISHAEAPSAITSYTLTITREEKPVSAMLASVEIAGQGDTQGVMSPAFDPKVHDYTVKLSAKEQQISMTATLQEDVEAEIEASWKHFANNRDTSATLHSGIPSVLRDAVFSGYRGHGNIICVTVGSGENAQEYRFTIEKEFPLILLQAQQIGGEDIALTPAFDETVHAYKAAVSADTEEVKLAATCYASRALQGYDPGGNVTINGKEMPQTQDKDALEYETFALAEGENVFTIKTSHTEAPTATATYTLTITREAMPLPALLQSVMIQDGDSEHATVLPIRPAFDPEVLDYTITARDDQSDAYLTADLIDGFEEASITAKWTDIHGIEKSKTVHASEPARIDELFGLAASGHGNKLELILSAKGQEQIYTFTVQKEFLLHGLDVQNTAGKPYELSPAFDADTKSYCVSVPLAEEQVKITALPFATINNEEDLEFYGHTVTIDGKEVDDTYGAMIDLTAEETNVEIEISHGQAPGVASKYTLTLLKEDPGPMLDEIVLRAAAVAYSAEHTLAPAFSPDHYEYNLEIRDNTQTTGIWAVLSEEGKQAGAKVEARYKSAVDGSQKILPIDTNKLPDMTGLNLSELIEQAGLGNSLKVRVTSSDGTRREAYTFEIDRTRSLEGLKLRTSERTLDINPRFNSSVYDSKVEVLQTDRYVDVYPQAQGMQGYILEVNAESVDKDGKVRVELDTENESDEQIEITVGHEDGYSPSTYTVTVEKAKTANVTFSTQPENANVTVERYQGKNLLERMYRNEDGSFAVQEGTEYKYTVTAAGYIGTSDMFIAADGKNIAVNLEKSPHNPDIDTDIESAWPGFRPNEDNNALVDVPIPENPEDAILHYAMRSGEGWSNAPSVLILVDGDMVFASGREIIKMDKITGEVVARGSMMMNAAFGIVPPLYAEGIIFMPLGGGIIQAFNAKTLESLYYYKDPNGGAPNSPLTYSNGHVYGGFFRSETAAADLVCISIVDEDPARPDEQKEAVWRHVQDGGFYWAGALARKDYVLVGTENGVNDYTSRFAKIMSLDAKTGEVIDSVGGIAGDIRSTIAYDSGTDAYYFTSKAGYFYSIQTNPDGTFKEGSLKELQLTNNVGYNENGESVPMSTSTPVIANGRAYVGVCGAGQFSTDYGGHNISVIDLASFSIAYMAPTRGYVQTSGVATQKGEYNYVYFQENTYPGSIRYLIDKPGTTAVINPSIETYTHKQTGEEWEIECAPIYFTPKGNHGQHGLSSMVVDEYGRLYFKNDSGHMFVVGSKVERLEVVSQPTRTVYAEGEQFDPAGMEVVAHFKNGTSFDVTRAMKIEYEELAVGTPHITLEYPFVEYNNEVDEDGNELVHKKPIVTQAITVLGVEEGSDELKAAIDAIEEAATLTDRAYEIVEGEYQPEEGETVETQEEAIENARTAITAARNLYDALSDDLKEALGDTIYQKLLDAEAKFEGLKSDDEQLTEFRAMIDALDSPIKLSSAEAVYRAEEYYHALKDRVKDQLEQPYKTKLNNAIQTLEKLVLEAVEKVEALIDAIAIDESGKPDAQAVSKARAAYDALPEIIQPKVSNLDKLIDAEIELGASRLIEKVEALIDKIDNYYITLDSEPAIEAARKAYKELRDDLKSRVSNYDKLVAAEQALERYKLAKIEKVEKLISSIGTVMLFSEEDIVKARAAYDNLRTDLAVKVRNIKVLVDAEAAYKKLVEDEAKIQDVIKLIDEIGTVTLESENAILSARSAYSLLPVELAKKVKNIGVLDRAEITLARMQTEAILKVTDSIDAIGGVTLASKLDIRAARELYNKLPASLRPRVTNYELLTKAEDRLKQLEEAEEVNKQKISVVEKLINNIGPVTQNSKAAIQAARKAYNQLPTELRARVSNIAVLELAEQVYAGLQSKNTEDGSDTGADNNGSDTGADNSGSSGQIGDGSTGSGNSGSSIRDAAKGRANPSSPIGRRKDADDADADDGEEGISAAGKGQDDADDPMLTGAVEDAAAQDKTDEGQTMDVLEDEPVPLSAKDKDLDAKQEDVSNSPNIGLLIAIIAAGAVLLVTYVLYTRKKKHAEEVSK